MNTKNITVTLDIETLEEIKSYAKATDISIEEFVECIIADFIRFQKAEMEEIYLNDDGTQWLMPTDSF